MRKIIKLSEKFLVDISKSSESGMGYHKVNVLLKDGNTLLKRTVLNRQFLVIEENENISLSEIKSVKITK